MPCAADCLIKRRIVSGRCGFTLVELIAVIAIVGVMSVTALVSMSGTDATRARAAGRALARDLTFARERAIATGATSWVVLSVGTNSYSILAEDPAVPGRAGAVAITDPATGQPFVMRLGQQETAGVVLQSVSIAGGGNDLGFDWLGRPLNAAGTRLTTSSSIALSSGVSISVSGGAGVATGP